jgi:hypothetical protein
MQLPSNAILQVERPQTMQKPVQPHGIATSAIHTQALSNARPHSTIKGCNCNQHKWTNPHHYTFRLCQHLPSALLHNLFHKQIVTSTSHKQALPHMHNNNSNVTISVHKQTSPYTGACIAMLFSDSGLLYFDGMLSHLILSGVFLVAKWINVIKFPQRFDQSCTCVMSFRFLSKNGLICVSMSKHVKYSTLVDII